MPTWGLTGRLPRLLPGVSWDTYITSNGVAIHGTYWHNDFSTTHSHGCINLTPEAAYRVHRWTSPPVPPGEKLLLVPGVETRVWILRTRISHFRSEP